MRKLRNSTINTTGHRGNKKHPLYHTWKSMISRCYYDSHQWYKEYGGKGISVDPRWLDFNLFILDVESRPSPEYQLDRIDTNGHYGPRNFRWATPSQNTVNSRPRNNRKYKGVYKQLGSNVYFSAITVGGKSLYIGSFKEECDAAMSYNEIALEWYGTYARLNTAEE